MNREEFIMSEVNNHFREAESLGFDVFALFLQGSQNYGLDEYSDEYKSDIDTKAIIIPSLNELLSYNRTPYSHTHVREDNSHIDIKDVRVMFEMFKKQNTSYLELLFSKYLIVNPKYQKFFDELISMREDISHYNPNQHLRALCGSAHNKFLAMTHISPHSEEKIKKFGYDPKELHHLVRYLDILEKYIAGAPYDVCLDPTDKKTLMAIKKGNFFTLEKALEVGEYTDKEIKRLADENMQSPEPINKELGIKMDKLLMSILKFKVSEEIKNGE